MKCFTHAQVVLRAREHPRVLLSCPIPTFFCSILLYSQNFEYHVSTLENLIKYSFHFKVIIFSYAQMLILLIQLTVFTYFWSMRKTKLCLLVVWAFFVPIIIFIAQISLFIPVYWTIIVTRCIDLLFV